MKKNIMPILILLGLSCLFFIPHLAALEPDGPKIRGDDRYVGDFAGFRGNKIQIDLERTGYRVSLPLADDVGYMRMDYTPYRRQNLSPGTPVKAIEVEGEIVQVIIQLELPH